MLRGLITITTTKHYIAVLHKMLFWKFLMQQVTTNSPLKARWYIYYRGLIAPKVVLWCRDLGIVVVNMDESSSSRSYGTNLGSLHELLVEGGEHMLHGPLQVTQLHLEYSLKSKGSVPFNIELCLFPTKNLRSMSTNAKPLLQIISRRKHIINQNWKIAFEIEYMWNI